MTIEAIFGLIYQTFVAVGNIRKIRRKTKKKAIIFMLMERNLSFTPVISGVNCSSIVAMFCLQV